MIDSIIIYIYHRRNIMLGRMAHMKIFEEIPLSNNLTIEVWDLSRPIAADTTKVEILIKIKVDLKSSYFIKPEHFELVKNILGPQIFFEYRKERTFVNNCDRDAIFQELLDSFKRVLTLPFQTGVPRQFCFVQVLGYRKK